MTLAVTGLLHLAAGSPAVGGPARAIVGAGGYVGAALAAPLHAVLAAWGASVVLVALGLAGLLVATRTSVGRAARHLARAAAGAGRAVRHAGRLVVAWTTSFGDHGEAAGSRRASGPRRSTEAGPR